MTIQCDIVTQERMVYTGAVDYVSLPGSEGRMGILPNHAPLLAALDFGEVMVRVDGNEEYFAVGGGFAEVQPTHVIVLADSAERADEIDVERARQAREKAEKAMAEGVVQDEPLRYLEIQRALQRARIRVDVSRRRASGRHLRALPQAPREDED
jgi:F-type H+-transporting ATPase subunit epsilon